MEICPYCGSQDENHWFGCQFQFPFNSWSNQSLLSHPRMEELRQYFAAFAPAIPNWFVPVIEKARPIRPSVEELPIDLREDARFILCESIELIEDPHPDLIAFDKAMHDAIRAGDEWDLLYEMEKFFQWRWYYADKMLKQRSSKNAA